MTLTANLGYPRFGANRQLKRALEGYWWKKIDLQALLETGKQLRQEHWKIQQTAGIDIIPSNDFSFYDHVLDTTMMVGAIPARYAALVDGNELDLYFAMARGYQSGGIEIPAMEMTKWFDTNYHYIVPEIRAEQAYRFASTSVIEEFIEAKDAGIHTRPVILGPVSYLLLSKPVDTNTHPLDTLPALLPVYAEVLSKLAAVGADWVQMDEPCLVLDLDDAARDAYSTAYRKLAEVSGIRLMIATYFGGLEDNLSLAVHLPAAGLHLDAVRAPEQLEPVLAALPSDKTLSVGVVNGRNIWRTDLDVAYAQIQQAAAALGTERVQIAPSCSLMFNPHDLDLETGLDHELKSWLAFARQKLDELALLKRAANLSSHRDDDQLVEAFAASRAAANSRRNSARTGNPLVRSRMASVRDSMLRRSSTYPTRKAVQMQHLGLPLLPTTTIGSFPQTREIRAQRAAKNKGEITPEAYDEFLRAEIARTIRVQEQLGLDVLVHGEFERTDMVEYFGEKMTGIAFTQHGWVQSYGSRGVRPPVIYGDVARPAPMTVSWSRYAQSLTNSPVKGMLTGPVTILEWSFVRDDQPRADTCRQISLAIRDEVQDLENVGIRVIQIDEPAFREGLPLRRSAHGEYLRWAIDCFRLASSAVKDETQIHTHMCYAEFNDIIDAIAQMDADVISIEASRSRMELLDAFQRTQYPGDIGPGIYDIHSPNIPSQVEMEALIEKAARVIPIERLWVNPDCGLKTRHWDEVLPSLERMVNAARACRERQNAAQAS